MGISVTSKADLRKKVLELRKNLTKEETDGWDQAICQKIKNLGWKNSMVLFTVISAFAVRQVRKR